MSTKEFCVRSIKDLKLVCGHLTNEVRQEKIVLFFGEMGVGKTTLIKEFCKHLGVADEVSSPTFSLVNEYESKLGPIYHFDLYRVQSEEELYDIGYEDYFYSGYLCLVEWPEMASGLLPEKYVSVKIRVENDQRIITVTH